MFELEFQAKYRLGLATGTRNDFSIMFEHQKGKQWLGGKWRMSEFKKKEDKKPIQEDSASFSGASDDQSRTASRNASCHGELKVVFTSEASQAHPTIYGILHILAQSVYKHYLYPRQRLQYSELIIKKKRKKKVRLHTIRLFYRNSM